LCCSTFVLTVECLLLLDLTSSVRSLLEERLRNDMLECGAKPYLLTHCFLFVSTVNVFPISDVWYLQYFMLV